MRPVPAEACARFFIQVAPQRKEGWYRISVLQPELGYKRKCRYYRLPHLGYRLRLHQRHLSFYPETISSPHILETWIQDVPDTSISDIFSHSRLLFDSFIESEDWVSSSIRTLLLTNLRSMISFQFLYETWKLHLIPLSFPERKKYAVHAKTSSQTGKTILHRFLCDPEEVYHRKARLQHGRPMNVRLDWGGGAQACNL